MLLLFQPFPVANKVDFNPTLRWLLIGCLRFRPVHTRRSSGQLITDTAACRQRHSCFCSLNHDRLAQLGADWAAYTSKHRFTYVSATPRICCNECIRGVAGFIGIRFRRYFYMYSVSQKKSPPSNFLTFFPKRLGIFSTNFTRLLYVPIYAGIQIFIQLPATSIWNDLKSFDLKS